MTRGRRSLFERLTGGTNMEEEEVVATPTKGHHAAKQHETSGDWEAEQGDAQLTIDVYQTPTEIVLQSIVAGVKPEDLEVNVTREMVTVKGTRHKHNEVRDEDFFMRELYWGTFSRSVLLPQEIEVERAEAGVKNGILTIRLPKVNREKSSNIKVKLL